MFTVVFGDQYFIMIYMCVSFILCDFVSTEFQNFKFYSNFSKFVCIIDSPITFFPHNACLGIRFYIRCIDGLKEI